MAFKGITAFILNNGEGGGGGEPSGNYNDLTNHPQVNGNELIGNKTAEQLGLLSADTDIPTKLSDLDEDTTHRTVTDSEKQSWNNKVDSVAGKGLSTNDYTDGDKEDVAKVDGLVGTVSSLSSSVGIVSGKVRTLEEEMLSVEDTLDTKVDKETGKGLSTNDYSNADKAIVDGVTTALADKVDKETGKGLSTNDYSNTDKAIVDGVTTALAGKVDTSTIAPVESSTSASKLITAGEHFMNDGDFCTAKTAILQNETFNDNNTKRGTVAEELESINSQIAIIEKKLFPPSILYAFHIDGNESDPLSKVRYLEDCAGYSPAYMDFQNGIFHYGSWSENEFFMPRPCMLRYNGTVDYYLSKHDYTKKADGVTASDVADTAYNGNAMLEFGRDNKKIWYKVVPDTGDDSSFTVYISDGQVDENFHCWSFINNQGDLVPHFYLSIYNGSVVSDVMRSISGQAVSKFLTGTQEREKARANNQTSDRLWDIECFADYQLLELLTWLIGKSTDSQAVFGKGLIDSGSEAINDDFRTGVQNAKGLFFGTNSGAAATYTNAIKMFGKENLWGFQWRRMNGWCMYNGIQKIKLTKGTQDGSTATDYNDDGTNYLNMGSTPGGTSSGYVNVAYSNNKGIVIPKTASGNSVSHYCDGLWFNNSGARLALVGGYSHYGARCGVSYANLDSTVSAATWYLGASLSCKPLA